MKTEPYSVSVLASLVARLPNPHVFASELREAEWFGEVIG
ncbi:hypothetical protein CES85_3623 (plasmid) [Ochrobactrum quorumnocens]|uniref:Uncharacterized protein n=1 Tax=Ochrobactrum quorumnocens TaxID=271865 RepID=A0A248UQ14_9HYPH|nr:hypothetical protein CES85_3623 [[Ochrobactrum] quorumnocens]